MTDKEIYKRIYDKLPYKWEQVTLNQYNKLMNIKPVNGDDINVEQVDNNIKFIAALSGELEATVEALPYQMVIILIDKIKFITEPISVSGKSSINFKDIDKITWDEYIILNKCLEQPTTNYIPVLSAIIQDKTIDVGNISIVDAHRGFFLLQKKYHKLLKRTLLYTSLKLIYQVMTLKVLHLFNKTKQEH